MTKLIYLATVLAVLSVPAAVHGQVVQLPTFRSFSVATTVVVPDSGGAYLGGVKRAAYGSSSSGVPGLSGLPGAGRLFGNRAYGSDVSSSGAYATATIIDLDELDRAVLAEAKARREGVMLTPGRPAGTVAATNPETARKAAFLAQHIGRSSAASGSTARQARALGTRQK